MSFAARVLRKEAQTYRRLGRQAPDLRARALLFEMARELEARAAVIEGDLEANPVQDDQVPIERHG